MRKIKKKKRFGNENDYIRIHPLNPTKKQVWSWLQILGVLCYTRKKIYSWWWEGLI